MSSAAADRPPSPAVSRRYPPRRYGPRLVGIVRGCLKTHNAYNHRRALCRPQTRHRLAPWNLGMSAVKMPVVESAAFQNEPRGLRPSSYAPDRREQPRLGATALTANILLRRVGSGCLDET
jgi:hypothetical protein